MTALKLDQPQSSAVLLYSIDLRKLRSCDLEFNRIDGILMVGHIYGLLTTVAEQTRLDLQNEEPHLPNPSSLVCSGDDCPYLRTGSTITDSIV